MTPLKQQLRLLMAEHGLPTVNTTLHEILQEDYQYLRTLFGSASTPQGAPVHVGEGVRASSPLVDMEPSAAAPVPALPSQAHATMSDSTAKKIRVRVTKAKVEEVPVPVEASATTAEVTQTSLLNIMLPQETVSSPPSTVSSPRSQPVQRTSQDIKKFQKVAEETKRRELKEKGITLEQVLTKENLQKWIVEEKHTFAWVAREKAGCSETQVSSIAKSMGIQSSISARRGMMVGRKA